MSVSPYSFVEGDNSIIRESENVVMANWEQDVVEFNKENGI
jgi:hypothetical protein